MLWRVFFLTMLFLLSGCQSNKVKPSVPEDLLKPCKIHSITGNTVKDAIEQSVKNIESLELCNADKEAIKNLLQ